MKCKIYQLPILNLSVIIFLFSCQSQVQEDNTAYERFKQKKLKENDSISTESDFVSTKPEHKDSSIVVHHRHQGHTGPITASATISKAASGTVSDAESDLEQSSAEAAQIKKAYVLTDKSATVTDPKRKQVKQKKHIEWPKINKINLKKKKKQKKDEDLG